MEITNRFIAKLSTTVRQRLLKHMEPVYLAFEQVLYHETESIRFAYFPSGAVLSALAIMQDGTPIEVATVGNEGLIGHYSVGENVISPNKVIVQVPGNGYRIPIDKLNRELNASPAIRQLMSYYQFAFLQQLSQSVACNGLHSINLRCCRWLLMTRERVGNDSIHLTHEYLGVMLGVRRASVSETLKPLQDAGILRSHRGTITILDAEGLQARACECYQVIIPCQSLRIATCAISCIRYANTHLLPKIQPCGNTKKFKVARYLRTRNKMLSNDTLTS